MIMTQYKLQLNQDCGGGREKNSSINDRKGAFS